MNQDVKTCVDAKLNVFRDYFDVPVNVQPEMDALIAKVVALGEECQEALEFESRFAAEIQNDYNGMFMKCTPRAVEMSAKQKSESKRLADQLQYGTDDPKKVAAAKMADAAKEAADFAAMEAREKSISMRRQAMIESGTFDEYTRMSNKVDNAVRGAKFLSGLFKKK